MFGPDGKLYVVIGEVGRPTLAQNLASLAGKMLRLDADGTAPSDNPLAGSPIIAYGIRNSFGFTFDPLTERLWETENGPACNDEVNLVPLTLPNLGWGPSQTCGPPLPAPRNTNQDGPSPVLPKLFFATTPATDRGRLLPTSAGSQATAGSSSATTTTGTIRRATLTSARTGIASRAPFYDHPDAVLSLETPVDGGPIYFSTTKNIFRLNP